MKDNILGKFIKEKRLGMNLTQAQLAKKSGISYESICYIETGKKKPQMKSVVGLAKGLKINFESLNKMKNEEN